MIIINVPKFIIILLLFVVFNEGISAAQYSLQRSLMGRQLKMSYRLWDENGVSSLGVLAKPVGFVLNIVGDLLRIQGTSSIYPPSEVKKLLSDTLTSCPKNGINTQQNLKDLINSYVGILEASNPTRNAAYSPKMNGFWRMTYTDYSPSGPSSGQLGPFVGDVFQDLDSTKGVIKNLLKIDFPPVVGGLIGLQTIEDPSTWRIEFDKVGNTFAGVFTTPAKSFKRGDQIRLWQITYLDEDLRILRARRVEAPLNESFLFVFVREESSRFQISI